MQNKETLFEIRMLTIVQECKLNFFPLRKHDK